MEVEKEDLNQEIRRKQDQIREYERVLDLNKQIIKKKKRVLLIHYHNLLMEGKDTRKEGLIWIVKAIWNMGKQVMPSFLPRFFDEELIKFLFAYAKDLLTYDQIRKDMQKFQYENQKHRTKSFRVLNNKPTEYGNFNFNQLFKTDVKTAITQGNKSKITRRFVFD